MFQAEDLLNKAIMAKFLSGISTRKYIMTVEGNSTDVIYTSKSEVSRRFIEDMNTLNGGIL